MQRITEVIGNLADERLAEAHRCCRESDGVERVRLDMWTAQKSRLRVSTDRGGELGIMLGREQSLADGDVLLWDEAAGRMVVVEVEGRQVMVCDIAPQQDAAATAQLALELGHALGNQHWPIKAQGSRVYVPVIADQAIMDAMMRARNLPDVSWHFTDATPDMNLPATAPSHEPMGHEHGHDHDHGYAHDHGHGHAHSHHQGAAGAV